MKNNFTLVLKELREKKGISQTELSQHLDIARATLSNYESGRSEPVLCNLIKLADFFECSLDELVFGIKQNPSLDLKYNKYSHELGTVLKKLDKIPLENIISSLQNIKKDFDEIQESKNEQL